MKDIEVFLISGKIGVGKNFVVEKILSPLLEEKPTIFLAFADHFKVEVVVKDGFSHADIFHNKTKESRQFIQKRGTKEGREVYGPDIWVNITKEWIQIFRERGIERFFIMDCRFLSEINGMEEFNPIKIKVESKDRNHQKLLEESKGDEEIYKAISTHISETDLDNYSDFDYTISNNYKDNAFIQCREIVRDIEEKNKPENIIFCDLDNTICECGKYYNEQRQKLYNLIHKYIDKTNFQDEVEINVYFHELYNELTDGFYNEVFQVETFALSLVDIITEFEPKFINLTPKELTDLKLKAYTLGMEVFDHHYEAYPNALESIKELEKYGKVIFVTYGNRKEQIKKLAYLGLLHHDNHITAHKNKWTFHNLMQKYKANNYYMIGDSLHSDVIPALDAGIKNVFWINGDSEKIANTAYEPIIVNDLSEVAEFLEIKSNVK